MTVRRLFLNLSRYPTFELAIALLVGLVGVLTDKSNQPLFSFVLYALCGVVGLILRPVVNRTSLRLCWIYLAAGLSVLLLEFLYFARETNGILDIFLIPLGIGIVIPAVGSMLNRIFSTTCAR